MSLFRLMKVQVRKVVHHQKILDESMMKKYQLMINITNLLIIIPLQQLPRPATDDDHHLMILIIQIEDQVDQRHQEYIITIY